MSTTALLTVFGLLMSTVKAKSHYIHVSMDGLQYFTPDLTSTLESYADLLESGVIRISAHCWPKLLAATTAGDVDHLKNATVELNIEPRLCNSQACVAIKNEIIERISAGEHIAMVGMQCWGLLNQAYCFNAMAYRYQTFGIDAGERELTTAEYLDLKGLTAQLSIGWVHTLCHRAFNWTAGKQKETGMSDVKAAKLAIGSVIRQFTWSTEKAPIGEMYTRPKSLVIFGLERVFKDIFGIAPDALYILTPDIDYLQQCLVDKYALTSTA